VEDDFPSVVAQLDAKVINNSTASSSNVVFMKSFFSQIATTRIVAPDGKRLK